MFPLLDQQIALHTMYSAGSCFVDRRLEYSLYGRERGHFGKIWWTDVQFTNFAGLTNTFTQKIPMLISQIYNLLYP